MENQLNLFLSVALQRCSVISAFKTSLVVGTIVNLINQGDYLLGSGIVQVSWLKVLITYFIPFAVSIYVGTTARLQYYPGVRAVFETDLSCSTCHQSISVDKNQIVPDCSSCSEETSWIRR